jgi:hypothetical protein
MTGWMAFLTGLIVGMILGAFLTGCAGREVGVGSMWTGDRVDLYKADGQRGAYGVGQTDGTWDLYRADGTRLGTVTPGRVILAPGGRR